MNNLILAIKDFFTFRFLAFSFVPLIVSSLIFIIIFKFFINYITNIDFNEEAFSFFLGIYILHALQILIFILGNVFGAYLSVNLSIIFALIIISFLTPLIVKAINLKHYNYNKLDEISLGYTCWMIFKLFMKFGFLLFCVLISYLIPIINIFSSIFLFFLMFYLFFNLLMIDVASCVLNKNDFLKFNPLKFHYIIWVFLFYLICNIPWIGFFLPVFIVIFLTHLMYQKELLVKSMLIDYK